MHRRVRSAAQLLGVSTSRENEGGRELGPGRDGGEEERDGRRRRPPRARARSQPVARHGPEDDGQDGDERARDERDPQGAAEQELAHVGLADPDRAERGLCARATGGRARREGECGAGCEGRGARGGEGRGREGRRSQRAVPRKVRRGGARTRSEGGTPPRKREEAHRLGEAHEDHERVEVVRVRDNVDDGDREGEDDLRGARGEVSSCASLLRGLHRERERERGDAPRAGEPWAWRRAR